MLFWLSLTYDCVVCWQAVFIQYTLFTTLSLKWYAAAQELVFACSRYFISGFMPSLGKPNMFEDLVSFQQASVKPYLPKDATWRHWTTLKHSSCPPYRLVHIYNIYGIIWIDIYIYTSSESSNLGWVVGELQSFIFSFSWFNYVVVLASLYCRIYINFYRGVWHQILNIEIQELVTQTNRSSLSSLNPWDFSRKMACGPWSRWPWSSPPWPVSLGSNDFTTTSCVCFGSKWSKMFFNNQTCQSIAVTTNKKALHWPWASH